MSLLGCWGCCGSRTRRRLRCRHCPGCQDSSPIFVEAGTAVALQSDGDLDDLPAALDATAYRILQEALTNVVKHAPGTTAQVRLLRSADHLEIEVCNAQVAGAAVQGGTGHGLLGIRERAAVFGGHLENGSTADGVYRLNVWLPLDAGSHSEASRLGVTVIKVVVADDETLFRSGLAMIVGAQDDLDMVAEAKDGHEAVEVVRRHRPDVVLMDIQMPGLDGIKATKEIVRLGLPTRVLILTTFGIDRNVYAALRGRRQRIPAEDRSAEPAGGRGARRGRR